MFLGDLGLFAGAAPGVDDFSAIGRPHSRPKTAFPGPFTLRNSMWIMHVCLPLYDDFI
jgi:hypothetical protein